MASRKRKSRDLSRLAEELESAKVDYELTPSKVTKLILLLRQQEYTIKAAQEEFEDKHNELHDQFKATDDSIRRNSLMSMMAKYEESHEMIIEKMESDMEGTKKLLSKVVH